jgi:hypothetical protein
MFTLNSSSNNRKFLTRKTTQIEKRINNTYSKKNFKKVKKAMLNKEMLHSFYQFNIYI